MTADEVESSVADREFFRVKTTLAFRTSPVEADRYQEIASEILTQVDRALPDVDPALIGWLDRLERKLDRLLDHHGLAAHHALDERERVTVELSGSGLSFPSETALEAGTAVLVEFELPETPIRRVRCLTRVVQGSDRGDGRVGVSFETIRLVDRDAVVRHTLAVQRQALAGEQGDRS